MGVQLPNTNSLRYQGATLPNWRLRFLSSTARPASWLSFGPAAGAAGSRTEAAPACTVLARHPGSFDPRLAKGVSPIHFLNVPVHTGLTPAC